MDSASTPPPGYGEGANRPLYYDVMHACRAQPHACRPRHPRPPTPRTGGEAGEAHEELYHDKTRPACPRTVFGPSPTTRLRLRVAQARGLLSVYKKRGTLF